MFTGLIQDIGEIQTIEQHDKDMRLRIGVGGLNLETEEIGASICCSGVCLSVTQKGDDWFDVDVSRETLSKTTAKMWKEGVALNLEPSLRLGDALGGHFVFGHVDGVAEITAITQEGGSHRVRIAPPADLMQFIAPKGSIALDGVSLTVNEVETDWFGVNIIPHTWEETTFKTYKQGDSINIEIDMLARYVRRMLGAT